MMRIGVILSLTFGLFFAATWVNLASAVEAQRPGRTGTTLQKPAIGGPFREYRGQFLWPPDWLADLGGFELRYSHFKKRL